MPVVFSYIFIYTILFCSDMQWKKFYNWIIFILLQIRMCNVVLMPFDQNWPECG